MTTARHRDTDYVQFSNPIRLLESAVLIKLMK